MNATSVRLSDAPVAAERGPHGRPMLLFEDSELRNGDFILCRKTYTLDGHRPNTLRADILSAIQSRPLPIPDKLAFARVTINYGTANQSCGKLAHAILYSALGPDEADVAWAAFLIEFVSTWKKTAMRMRVGDIRSWFRDNYLPHCVLAAELDKKGKDA